MAAGEHGGQCCGISHVYDFPDRADKNWLDNEVTNAFSDLERDREEYYNDNGEAPPWRTFGHCVEICLTDWQMGIWASTLKEYGFSLHTRWKNDNSGNYCNLLSYRTKTPSSPAPYKW